MLLVRSEFSEYHKQQKASELSDSDAPNIFDAAAYGTVEQLDEALKNWDVNATDDIGMTALHHAAISLKFDNVDRLLEEIENGLDPQIEDNFGRDPAWAIVDVHGPNYLNPRAQKMYDKLSPFVYPIAEEDKDLFADDAPMTFFEAARSPDIKWLNQALEKNDVNTLDEDGRSALHHAAYALAFRQADRLLEEIPNGFDPTVVDNNGQNAAEYVLDYYGLDHPNHKEAVRMHEKLSPYMSTGQYHDLDAPEA